VLVRLGLECVHRLAAPGEVARRPLDKWVLGVGGPPRDEGSGKVQGRSLESVVRLETKRAPRGTPNTSCTYMREAGEPAIAPVSPPSRRPEREVASQVFLGVPTVLRSASLSCLAVAAVTGVDTSS
jgi:hypothetical protein